MGAVEDVLFFVAVFREFGVPVEFEPDWERRGNGSTANYQGGILHHTAIAASYANPGPGTRVLRDGRPDLPGPLCQYQNKFTGTVRVIAAHPANHAGASGGRSMGPLPVSRLFNPLVQGMENDYAGNSPMSPEQYRTSLVFAIACKRRYGSIERCRAHMETSIEGKWDPGWAPGRTIDMTTFRRDALALEAGGGTFQEDDMLTGAQEQWLLDLHKVVVSGATRTAKLNLDLGFVRDSIIADIGAVKALLATVLAAQKDDLSDTDVLARLDAKLDEQWAEVEQRLEQARQADREAMEAAVRDVLGEDNDGQADEIVRKLGERLTGTEAA